MRQKKKQMINVVGQVLRLSKTWTTVKVQETHFGKYGFGWRQKLPTGGGGVGGGGWHKCFSERMWDGGR